MIKYIISLVLLLSCAHREESLRDNIDAYRKEAESLVSLAKNERATKQDISKKAYKLISLAKPIISEFMAKQKKCKVVLQKVLDDSTLMTNISLKKIEIDYHDGEALPKADEDCYEPKELIVHPATVVIITKEKFNIKGRDQIIDEIDEVLSHLEVMLKI